MKNYKQDLTFYYQACNKVAKIFSDIYFCDKNMEFTDLDEWWVAGDVGTVICINDYYWNMEDMVEALNVGVNKKTLFEYYDWMVDDEKGNKSLHYFLNLKKLNLCKPTIPVECISNKKHSTGFNQFSNPLEEEKYEKLKKDGWPNLVKLLKPNK